MSLGVAHYLATVSDSILDVSIISSTLLTCGMVVCFAMWFIDDVKLARKIGLVLIAPFLFLTLLSVIIPKKEDSLKILALHYGEKGVAAILKELCEFYPMIKELAKKELKKAAEEK